MKRECIITIISLLLLITVGVTPSSASQTDGTIEANNKYAWGENIGWINFAANGDNIHVTDSAVTGFAWSQNYGWINLNPTNGGVTNTSGGLLGGQAWSSTLGWIPFTGVTINAVGKVTGMAGTAGSTAGRINFDCSNCSVTTDWRPVSVRNSPSQSSPTATTGTTTSTTTTSTIPTPTTTAIVVAPGTGGTPVAASPEVQTPPLFDIVVGPGSLESKKANIPILAIIAAIIAAATALVMFYIFKRRKKRTNET